MIYRDQSLKKTTELESIYIFYKNSVYAIFLASLVGIVLVISQENTGILVVYVVIFVIDVQILGYGGLIAIGRMYTKQILLEYYLTNKTTT